MSCFAGSLHQPLPHSPVGKPRTLLCPPARIHQNPENKTKFRFRYLVAVALQHTFRRHTRTSLMARSTSPSADSPPTKGPVIPRWRSLQLVMRAGSYVMNGHRVCLFWELAQYARHDRRTEQRDWRVDHVHDAIKGERESGVMGASFMDTAGVPMNERHPGRTFAHSLLVAEIFACSRAPSAIDNVDDLSIKAPV